MLVYLPNWNCYSGNSMFRLLLSLVISAILFVGLGYAKTRTCSGSEITNTGFHAVNHAEKILVKSEFLLESEYYFSRVQGKNVTGKSHAIIRSCYLLCFSSSLLYINCADLSPTDHTSKGHQNPLIFSCLFVRGP